jgi:hypothetical protein
LQASHIAWGKPPDIGGFSASESKKNPVPLLDIAKALC